MSKNPLPGSEREPIKGARAAEKCGATDRLNVTVVVRRRGAAEFDAHVAKLASSGSAGAAPLTRAEYAQRFGADPADLAAVRKFATGHGLSIATEDAARRTTVLSGTVTQFNQAFGVDLHRYQHSGGSYRGYEGPIHLPAELQGVVEAVLGLDDRQQAKPHFRVQAPSKIRAAAASASFTPLQIASLYGFPAGNGKGQSIALIELGGGFVATDLATYFAGLGVSPAPSVVAVGVDGATNAPTGETDGPDGEVMLDIEVAGAIAPAASIAVYFAPNTDAGFLDAITSAIHDTTHAPHVISISWGGPESTWSKTAMTSFDQAFQEAATLGITVTVAAGDGGSSDGLTGDHVDFPASSPHVLACGGTHLAASASAISSETVWNDGSSGGATGGGVSTNFATPTWQKGLSAKKTSGASAALKKRGVPDVAGDADPESGYKVRVDGQNLVFGGTSAVAPLWAALIARINALKGSPAGFVNATLYAHPTAFRDISSGNNGDYAAAKGWDACTGLGAPVGASIRTALGA
jgi:kumamolisin